MKGTEKQIAWATEIQNNLTKTLDAAIEMFSAAPAPEEIRQKNVEDATAWKEAILGAEHAGDIIELFKDIRFTGAPERDFPAMMATRRVTPAKTDAHKALLHK